MANLDKKTLSMAIAAQDSASIDLKWLQKEFTETTARMRIPSFLEENQLLYRIAKYGTYVHHSISYLMSVCMLVLVFIKEFDINISRTIAEIIIAILVFVILLFLYLGIELGKNRYSVKYFKFRNINNLKLENGNRYAFFLAFFCFFSITTSGVAGYYMAFQASDKQKEINLNFASDTSSVNRKYFALTDSINNEINEVKTGRTYLKRIHWVYKKFNRKDYEMSNEGLSKLDKLDNQKLELEKEKKTELSRLKAKQGEKIVENGSNQTLYASVTAVSITILELLAILAYNFQFFYCSKLNKSIISALEKDSPSPSEETKESLLLQSIIEEEHVEEVEEKVNTEEESTMGFEVPNPKKDVTVNGKSVIAKREKTGLCHNCSKKLTGKQQYWCCDNCRAIGNIKEGRFLISKQT